MACETHLMSCPFQSGGPSQDSARTGRWEYEAQQRFLIARQSFQALKHELDREIQ